MAGPIVFAYVICVVFGLPSIVFAIVAGFMVLRGVGEYRRARWRVKGAGDIGRLVLPEGMVLDGTGQLRPEPEGAKWQPAHWCLDCGKGSARCVCSPPWSWTTDPRAVITHPTPEEIRAAGYEPIECPAMGEPTMWVPGNRLEETRLLTADQVAQLRAGWQAKYGPGARVSETAESVPMVTIKAAPRQLGSAQAPRVCAHEEVEEIRSCVTGGLVALYCPVCDRQSTAHNGVLAKSLAPDPGMVAGYAAAWARLLNRDRDTRGV